MTSAAVYARVSSARQAKDETIGSQLAALRDHAVSNRLDVPQEWVFADEGHSGATLVRPGLEALRDLAARGCLDVVLVGKHSSRETEEGREKRGPGQTKKRRIYEMGGRGSRRPRPASFSV